MLSPRLSYVPFAGLREAAYRAAPRRLPEALWITALLIFIAQNGFDLSAPWLRIPRIALTAAACAALLVKLLLLDGRNTGELLAAGALILITAVGALFSRNRWFLRCMLLVLAARGISWKRICAGYLACLTGILLVNFLLSALGIVPDQIFMRPGETVLRHTFGFTHPNALAIWSFLIICSCLALLRGRSAVIGYPVFAAAAVVVYYFTNTRGAMAASVLAIAGCVIVRLFRPKLVKARWTAPLVIALSVLLPIVMIALSAVYDPEVPWLAFVDKLLSTRLFMANSALKSFSVSLFGNTGESALILPTGDGYTVDCQYVNSLLFMGILPCLAVYLPLPISIRKFARAGEPELLAVTCAMLACAAMEPCFQSCLFIPYFAAFADLPEAGSTPSTERN